MSVPAYVPYYIYVGAAAIIAAVLLGLRRALAEAKWPEHDRTQTVRTAAIILIGWFAFAVTLGALGAYAGKLPGLFAFPAGIGDILVGVLAPIVALAYARNPQASGPLVLAWNILGIADLIVAVTTGFISAPSPLLPSLVQPTSELISVLPLVVIPTFAVPLSIVLHVASLMKLRREMSHAPGRGKLALSGA